MNKILIIEDEEKIARFVELELEHEGETWGIYFPCYELPVFEELTGLKAAA